MVFCSNQAKVYQQQVVGVAVAAVAVECHYCYYFGCMTQ
jgi:hypothetical protein